jgi:hypothetical protein
MVTEMLGFAFSKALIAFAVCCPSVPRPDSAKVIVCFALDEALLVAAADAPTDAPAVTAPAERSATRAALDLNKLCIRLAPLLYWCRSFRA